MDFDLSPLPSPSVPSPSAPSAPQAEPPAPLPPPAPQAARHPRWNQSINLALALVFLGIVSYNVYLMHGPAAKKASKSTASLIEALAATKAAYVWPSLSASLDSALSRSRHNDTPTAPASIPKDDKPTEKPSRSGAKVGSSAGKSRRGASRPVMSSNERTQQRLEDTALDKLRELTAAYPTRPGVWRRLGIMQFAFHRPGGLNSFRRSQELVRAEWAEDEKTRRREDEKRRRGKTGDKRQETAEIAPNPPRHIPNTEHRTPNTAQERPALTTQEESTLWQAIYGTQPFPMPQTSHLRAQLAKLKLGWFENIAAESLYTRAGQKAEAMRAHTAALASAQEVMTLTSVRGVTLLLGVLGLMALAIYGGVKRRQRRLPLAPAYGYATGMPGYASQPPTSHDRPYSPNALPSGARSAFPVQETSIGYPAVPAYGAPPGYALLGSPLLVPPASFGYERLRPGDDFDYHELAPESRKIAFVAYLLTFSLIGLPVRLLLSQLEARGYLDLTDANRARFSIVVNLLVYIPVVLAPLLLLRHVENSKRRADGTPLLTWRELFRALGFRTRGVMGDLGMGIAGFILISPLFLLAAILSNYLFSRFHTPVNPVETVMAAIATPLDRFLIFVETAVAAPLVEETMFRGVLYPALRDRWGIAPAACVSAALFAGVHPTLPGQFLPIWTLGVAMALVYEWRGSLLPGIFLHGINNGLVLLTVLTILAK